MTSTSTPLSSRLPTPAERRWLEVEHRPDCACRGVSAQVPAWMWDERNLTSLGLPDGVDSLLATALFNAFVAAADTAGRPVARIYEQRWNGAGQLIGPRLEVRSCEADRFSLLLRRVGRLVETMAEEL